MAKRDRWWVSKMDQTLAGQKVNLGQLVAPTGARNDHIVFGDNSRWTHRWDGGEPIPCGTDGCPALFDSLGSLSRHRQLVHGPARERTQAAREAEESGETIGGHEVVKSKRGPHGEVPYIQPFG